VELLRKFKLRRKKKKRKKKKRKRLRRVEDIEEDRPFDAETVELLRKFKLRKKKKKRKRLRRVEDIEEDRPFDAETVELLRKFKLRRKKKKRKKKKKKSDPCANKECPPGKICNPKTGRCVNITGNIGKKIMAKINRSGNKKKTSHDTRRSVAARKRSLAREERNAKKKKKKKRKKKDCPKGEKKNKNPPPACQPVPYLLFIKLAKVNSNLKGRAILSAKAKAWTSSGKGKNLDILNKYKPDNNAVEWNKLIRALQAS
jgi:hypothetical protein